MRLWSRCSKNCWNVSRISAEVSAMWSVYELTTNVSAGGAFGGEAIPILRDRELSGLEDLTASPARRNAGYDGSARHLCCPRHIPDRGSKGSGVDRAVADDAVTLHQGGRLARSDAMRGLLE